MNAERLAVAGSRAWVVWLRTILGAVAANLVLRAAALAVFDIPPEFEPLAVAGPTVFLTVVGVAVGLGVALAVDKRSESPVPLFQRVVLAAPCCSRSSRTSGCSPTAAARRFRAPPFPPWRP